MTKVLPFRSHKSNPIVEKKRPPKLPPKPKPEASSRWEQRAQEQYTKGPPAKRKEIDTESPVARALVVLGTRAIRTDRDFFLDGRPAGLNQIIEAANHIYKEAGMPQIDNNPAWRV